MSKPIQMKYETAYAIKFSAGDDIRCFFSDVTKRSFFKNDKNFIIPVFGVLSQWDGYECSTYEGIKKLIATGLEDTDTRAIILDFDSPGGECLGIGGLAEYIYENRNKKPIIARVNSMACSGAYWLASACSKIILSSETTIVGSVGVVIVHEDISKQDDALGIKKTTIVAGKYKHIDSPNHPLSTEGRGYLQKDVDRYYEVFVNSIAKYRGISISTVLSFADGQTFLGSQAIAKGMADGIENKLMKGTVMDEELKLKYAELEQKFAELEKKLNEIISKMNPEPSAEDTEEKPACEDTPAIPDEENPEPTAEDMEEKIDEQTDVKPVSKATMQERKRILAITSLPINEKFAHIKTQAISAGWSPEKTALEILRAGSMQSSFGNKGKDTLRSESRYISAMHTGVNTKTSEEISYGKRMAEFINQGRK